MWSSTTTVGPRPAADRQSTLQRRRRLAASPDSSGFSCCPTAETAPAPHLLGVPHRLSSRSTLSQRLHRHADAARLRAAAMASPPAEAAARASACTGAADSILQRVTHRPARRLPAGRGALPGVPLRCSPALAAVFRGALRGGDAAVRPVRPGRARTGRSGADRALRPAAARPLGHQETARAAWASAAVRRRASG